MTAAISLAQAKTHLNITTTGYDAELGDYLSRATVAAESWIGGPISTASFTETHDGGSEAIILGRTPVQSVTAVTESGAAVTSSGWVLDDTAGLLYRGSSTAPSEWSDGRRNVQVAYVAGYPVVPDDLVQAVLETLRHLWTTQRGGMDGRNPFSGDEYATGTGWSLPRRVTELLEPYRHRAVG